MSKLWSSEAERRLLITQYLTQIESDARADALLQVAEHARQLEIENARLRAHAWISVSERLPEDWTLVIAVNDVGAMCVLNHIWQNKQYPKLGYLGSLEEERYDGVQDKLQNITHWMPLPQPPALSTAKERG